MTGSLGDVRFVIAEAAEQIGRAQQYTGVARARIADAIAALVALGEQHSEQLVPDELRKAADELDLAVALVGNCVAAVADIDARL